ncbi:2Fe-2S iron-sulfur cluster-binding protein [Herbiconiux sp. P15]|uniref:PDR/VanB family oxidoreductase n=1 Tax=Herbiconiux liukaitaii TaxID=3342799 RepID=UPI0035B88A84
MRTAGIPARVRTLGYEADDVISLVLERTDGAALPAWTAGSHIDVELPTGLTRQYSLCGDPRELGTYRVAVLRDAASRGASEYVHMFLRPGQQIRIGEPRNHFPLVPAERYFFIAGGIGVTPVLPLARQAAEHAPASVLYLGRGGTSLAFQDELHESAAEVSIHDSRVAGRHDLSTFLSGLDETTAVYVCGSDRLISAVEALAEEWPAGVLHTERFKPRPRVSTVAADFDVTWQPSGETFTIPADRSALDVLEEAGLPVGGSCRQGVCGACELVAVSGTPDHLDDVVDDHDRTEGERFFPCVSRAETPSLTVRAT